MKQTDRTVLILGANGRFGRHAARAFDRAGWTVRLYDRARDSLPTAAEGAAVIVNGWNPPYPDWESQIPGLTASLIAAAKTTGATVIQPGNVYVFGADTPVPWSERSPHRATNQLGRVRIAMEAQLRDTGIRTILLRAGDFIDTEASGNWFDAIMVKKLRRGVFTYPGDPDAAHAWAFLPDVTRAAVALAEIRDSLPDFTDIPFPGYTLTGREIADHLSAATGHEIRLRRMSWLPVHLARPFWRVATHLIEMRYLWMIPHSLDGARLAGLLPDFRPTPVADALRQALPAPAVDHSGARSTQTSR